MDAWVAHVSKSVGVPPATVRLAIGYVFGFLLKRYPNGPADELLNAIPGAFDAVAEAARWTPPKRKFTSRVLGTVGNWIGRRQGETYELTSRLLALGLTPDQLKRLAHEIFGGAAMVVGQEKMRIMTDPIPGLSPFLWPEEASTKPAGRRKRK